MAERIRDLMTPDPVVLPASTTVKDAASRMKANDIGDVLVSRDGGSICGMVTDRDIVVRAIAEGRDPDETKLDDICSHDLASVNADDPVDKAVKIMRDRNVRRVPVLDGDKALGMVSIGDLAIERDPESALADISSAPPNE